MPRLAVFIALIALLVQSLAMVIPGSFPGQAASVEHVMLHARATDHHHHDDLSLHVENDGESAQHFHADGGVTGILPAKETAFIGSAPTSHPPAAQAAILRPILDGPYRPPRLA